MELKPGDIFCSVDSCNRKKYRNVGGKPYCNRHRMQLRQNGKIFDRTTRDPNVFVFDDKVCRVFLYNFRCKHIATAEIDAKDYKMIRDHKWSLHSSGYAITHINNNIVFMHRLVLGAKKEVDHRDGDPLNNKRSNLRTCDHADNIKNQKKRVGTSSIFKGVSWNKEKKKWSVYINSDGIRHRLGYYDSETEAAAMYNTAAEKLHGEFGRLNQV